MAGEIISHIGIAVRSLEQSVPVYELLTGRKVSLITEVPEQKVKVAIFGASGESRPGVARIELVAPTSAESPVARFIEKRGEGLHHLCIYVSDLDRRLADLRAAGIRLIDEKPRIGAEGDRIAFVHPGGINGVLLEFHERVS